jgi:hypothetical protein
MPSGDQLTTIHSLASTRPGRAPSHEAYIKKHAMMQACEILPLGMCGIQGAGTAPARARALSLTPRATEPAATSASTASGSAAAVPAAPPNTRPPPSRPPPLPRSNPLNPPTPLPPPPRPNPLNSPPQLGEPQDEDAERWSPHPHCRACCWASSACLWAVVLHAAPAAVVALLPAAARVLVDLAYAGALTGRDAARRRVERGPHAARPAGAGPRVLPGGATGDGRGRPPVPVAAPMAQRARIP